MEALLVHTGSDNAMDQKWGKMVILSLILHLAVFSTILFVPEPSATRKIRNMVYEVNLVEMPEGRRPGMRTSAESNKSTGLSAPVKASHAKRLSRAKKEEKPVVIAKRTVNLKAKKTKTPEVSSSKLLDQILAEHEKETKEEKKDSIDASVSRLETKIQETTESGFIGRHAADGIIMDIYKADIKDWVCSNWSYPVALLGPDSTANLSTIVELKVEKSGTILRTTMTHSSGNASFDQSVLKAIKRSDPLPPFPEGYRKIQEVIEINFNLRDLKNQ